MRQVLIRLARMATLPLVVAMALSVLVQAYFAGAAAAVDADFWSLHKTWIAIFQWLSVVLAIVVFVGYRDLLTRLLSLVPIVIIAVQYTSIHLALRQSAAWLAGVHAANAPLLFGVLVLLAVRCRRAA